MKTQMKILIVLVLFSILCGLLAFKAMRVNYVYVPAVPGVPGVCTVPLLGYTFYNNGETPVTRVASSLPVTSGCRTNSIYPDPPGGK